MKKSRLDELGEVQREILQILWDRGEASVNEVREALSKIRPRLPAYTTVLSTLQKLEKSGWAKHRAEGRTYYYAAARSLKNERQTSLRSFIETLFHGRSELLLQHLLEDDEIDPEELSRLTKLIREAEGKEKEKE